MLGDILAAIWDVVWDLPRQRRLRRTLSDNLWREPGIYSGTLQIAKHLGDKVERIAGEVITAPEVEEDFAFIKEWVTDVFEADPPPDNIDILYFTIAVYAADESDLILAGVRSSRPAPPQSPERLDRDEWTPKRKGRHADRISSILSAVSGRFEAKGAEEEAFYYHGYTIAHAYACLVVDRLCREFDPKLLLGNADFRYVRVGYNDATETIGAITREGWKRRPGSVSERRFVL